jgi:hypothetical protein
MHVNATLHMYKQPFLLPKKDHRPRAMRSFAVLSVVIVIYGISFAMFDGRLISKVACTWAFR